MSVPIQRRAGFSLLEVLAALMIFAIAATVLGSSYVNVLNSYFTMGRINRSSDDLSFARAALLAEADLKKVEEGGDFAKADGRRVRWSATIEPTNVADLFTVIFHCEIDDPEQGKPIITDETFRLLRPTWSEPAEREKLRDEARKRILLIQEGRRI